MIAFDSLGRLTKTILPDPDPSDTDPARPEYRREYNDAGQVVKEIDPLGREILFGYVGDQLVTITRPDHDFDGNPTIVTNSYNAAGQLVASTDALGYVTSYAYTATGWLSSTTDPTGHASKMRAVMV